ncbi:polysaccharide biosynthesis protein [Algibacter lectus]|uniref:Polysaccharide biosynthesis protein n=1 Tax=Algibacter lectus TaxID=221126 RepID=A0A090WRZ0_9FLAO|nr:polysaccharide biosynthesis C-terminal domain-containing protein [Algibacter lectus]GAL79880.1 polysaccharide biosynthesis protein [Algibacter lectus]
MIKRLLKNKNRNHVIITQIINAAIGIISGKIIAVYVIPEEFGLYNIQFATFTFASTLLISPFLQYLKSTNKTLLPKLGTKIYFTAFTPILFIAIVAVILGLYLYTGHLSLNLAIILLIFIPLSSINNTLSDFLNINNQIQQFLKMSVLKSITSLCFLITFFILGITFFTEPEALWIMQLIGVTFGSIFFLNPISYLRFEVNLISFYKKYFKFAWPLMILAFWSWINNFFDRYAIDYFMTTDNVGIYNANYGLGSKFFLMLSPIFMVMITPLIYDVKRIEIKKTIISRYAKNYIIIGIVLLSFIYIFKNMIGNLLLSTLYKEGFYLIFWIAVAFFIITLTYLYETIFYAEGRTKVILFGNILSATLNIILNILLIPSFGLTGAFLATIGGFTLHLIYINIKFHKL